MSTRNLVMQLDRCLGEKKKLRAKVASWEKVFGHLGTPDEVGNEWIALKDRVAEAERKRDAYKVTLARIWLTLGVLEADADRTLNGDAGNKSEVPK